MRRLVWLELQITIANSAFVMSLPDFALNNLLPDGVHAATSEDLQTRCVTPFSTSTTRAGIFTAFTSYQEKIAALGLNVTQWVDGSFVDKSRLDPEDIDAVNFCDSVNINAVAGAHGTRITALLDGRESTKATYKTHTFLSIQFPNGHMMAATFEAQRKYWRTWFATPQDYAGPVKVPAPHRGRKGIVQMSVGNSTLCPTVNTAA